MLRENHNYTLAEVGAAIGASVQSLYKYENGIVTNIPSDKIEGLARIFSVSPAYLMGWEDEVNNNTYVHPDILPLRTKKIPLLGEVACGEPILVNREYELYEEVDETLNADFCVKAKGDSMINARIQDGDIVFIKRVPEVCNGEIAAVVIDDSVTLKRVYFNNDNKQLVLQAENIEHAPQVYIGSDLEQVRILGRAVGFQSIIK
jgi:repressor LexA